MAAQKMPLAVLLQVQNTGLSVLCHLKISSELFYLDLNWWPYSGETQSARFATCVQFAWNLDKYLRVELHMKA